MSPAAFQWARVGINSRWRLDGTPYQVALNDSGRTFSLYSVQGAHFANIGGRFRTLAGAQRTAEACAQAARRAGR